MDADIDDAIAELILVAVDTTEDVTVEAIPILDVVFSSNTSLNAGESSDKSAAGL